MLVEAAQAAARVGDTDTSLARARDAARLAPDVASTQLFARGLEYRLRGAGSVGGREGDHRGALAARPATRRSSPRTSRSARSSSPRPRTSSRRARASRRCATCLGAVGPQALVTLGLAERALAAGRWRGGGSLLHRRGLRQPARPSPSRAVALAAADAAERAGDADSMLRFLERGREGSRDARGGARSARPSSRSSIAIVGRARERASRPRRRARGRREGRGPRAARARALRLERARRSVSRRIARCARRSRPRRPSSRSAFASSSADSARVRRRASNPSMPVGPLRRSQLPIAVRRSAADAAARLAATPRRVRPSEPPQAPTRRRGHRSHSVGASDDARERARRDRSRRCVIRRSARPTAPPPLAAAAGRARGGARTRAAASRDHRGLRDVTPSIRMSCASPRRGKLLAAGEREQAEKLLSDALREGSIDAADELDRALLGGPVARRVAPQGAPSGGRARARATCAARGAPRRRAPRQEPELRSRARSRASRVRSVGASPLAPPPLSAQQTQPGMLTLLTRHSREVAGEAFGVVWEGATGLFAKPPPRIA